MVLPNRVMPVLLAGICTLASCGDSHLTSNIAAPQPENPYVAVFQARCCDGDDYNDQTSLLYKVDRQGEITPLPDNPKPGTAIAGLTASPDGRYIAYWQGPRPDEPAGATPDAKLVIDSVDATNGVQDFPVVATAAAREVQFDYYYELYVHDFQASQTQRIAPRIASERYVGIAFSWVSGENLLEYIGINGDKRVLMLTDPVTQRSVLIGEFDGAARSYWRIWRSASEVLWKSCEGIDLGELDAQWVVTNSKLLEVIFTDPYQCRPFDANQKFAVIDVYNPTIPAYGKFLYDFEGKRRVKLEAEDGSRVGSVILLGSE